MKKLIYLIFLALFVISCGETTDNKNDETEKTCNPECKTWQTCNTETLTCILKEGMCQSDDDCKNNKDNKVICDTEKHECIEKELTCNENKEASDYKLPADECGELTACDDSYDCAENQRCENLFIEGNENLTRPCCIEGPRGCKKTGEPCENEFDCESGLCIGRNENQKYCSKKCNPDNNDCPAPVSECKDLYIMHACVEPGE